MNTNEFQARIEEIDRLVQRVSALEDQEARGAALDLLQSSMDLHGAALSRMVEVLSQSGESGRTVLAKLGSDPLMCGLLVLYGVHPLTLEQRVRRALERLSPQLRKQNASVELIGLDETVARLRIEGSGHGCGSSLEAVKSLVQQAVLEAAPEVVEVVVESPPAAASGFVPLSTIQPTDKKEGKYEESAA